MFSYFILDSVPGCDMLVIFRGEARVFRMGPTGGLLERPHRLRPEGLKAGVGFLGKGSQLPPHQLGSLRERCELLQRGLRRSPDRPVVFLYFECSGWLLLVIPECRGTPPKGRNISSDLCKSHESSLSHPSTPPPSWLRAWLS